MESERERERVRLQSDLVLFVRLMHVVGLEVDNAKAKARRNEPSRMSYRSGTQWDHAGPRVGELQGTIPGGDARAQG